MKLALDHLPEDKRYQLKLAAEIILEMAEPEMLILFGSYARGDWVEERAPDGVHYQYQSDFDLLAVTRNEHLARKIERKDALRKRLSREVKTPVSLIAEDIHHVNLNLTKARYFYVDIVKEGVLLHDSGKVELAQPKELVPAERRKLAEEDFEYWVEKAKRIYGGYQYFLGQDNLNEAAFMLHQTAEHLYNAVLLVFTNYKPKTHDLARLDEHAAAVETEFVKVFPRGSDEEKRLFELLRRAYVDARYSKGYSITAEELAWLAERVVCLRELVGRLCLGKIEGYKRVDGA